MSGTATPLADIVTNPSLAGRVLEWPRPVIAFLTIGLFGAAFAAAIILVGAIVSGFSTITGYYFGSSSGSAKKDATIAAQLPAKP